MDERLGHEEGSIQFRYSYVTPKTRQRLMADLTEVWEASLQARWDLAAGSPVATLDALLKPRQPAESGRRFSRSSPNFLPKPPRKRIRAGLPEGKTGPDLHCHQSGWRDLNPRPLRPERDHGPVWRLRMPSTAALAAWWRSATVHTGLSESVLGGPLCGSPPGAAEAGARAGPGGCPDPRARPVGLVGGGQ